MPGPSDTPFHASRTLTNRLLTALVVTVAAGFFGAEVVPLLVLLGTSMALIVAAVAGGLDFMLPALDDEDGA